MKRNRYNEGMHSQHCANIVQDLAFVCVWICRKCSCIIHVIIMEVFGPRTKLIIIGQFCELVHFLF